MPSRPTSGEFDEVLSGPSFRMARKGRFLLVDTTRTEEEHRAIIETLASHKDELAGDIEKQIQELEAVLQQFEPFDIISNILFANSILDPETYKEYKHTGSPAYTEYVALLYLAQPRNAYPEINLRPIPAKVFEDIQHRVQQLFLSQIFYLAIKDIDPSQTSAPDLLSELRFKVLSQSLLVRFPAYHHHLVDLLADLFEPLQGDLYQTLGFNVSDALALSKGVESFLTRRLIERRNKARRFEKLFRKAVKQYKRKGKVIGEFTVDELKRLASMRPSEAAKHIQHISIAWTFFAIGNTFSFTANELSMESGIALERVSSFLHRLSVEFGEVENRYRYPSPTHPLMLKSFIRVNERFFCPGWDRICWNLRPAIEAYWNPDSPTAITNERSLWERYDKARSTYLEQKALGYLAQALKHAAVYGNLKYEIQEGERVKEVELDGLIILDSAIFLVEAKAGTASPPMRRGAKKRMVEELTELVEEAYQQALRAKRYIQQADQPRFRLGDGAVVDIPKRKIKRVFLVTVTLEYLDAMVTNLYKLQEIGFFGEHEFPWAVSLTDLRVISEFIEFPSQLVDYLERRGRINKQGFAEAPEELDWFGHYLAEGLYFDDTDRPAEKHGTIQLMSYTAPFDDYYLYTTGQRETPAPKPAQPMPGLLHEILAELETKHPDGYLDAACMLLSMAGETRDSFAENFARLKRQALQDKRFHDFTFTFNNPNTGVTCMFAPVGMLSGLGNRLAKYCGLKKYQMKYENWIGFGCLADSSELISHLYFNNTPWQYNDETENLVREFLSPPNTQ